MQSLEQFITSVRKFRSRLETADYEPSQKLIKLHQLFTLLVTTLSDESKVQFTSVFARLSYLISSYNIPYKESYILHSFRKRGATIHSDEQDLRIGQAAIRIIMAYVIEEVEDLSDIPDLYRSLTKGADYKKVLFKREVRVFLKSVNLKDKQIEAQLCDEPFDTVIVSYSRPDKNEDYAEIIEKANSAGLFPLTANLVDVEIDHSRVYYPSTIVLEPDYMYDVTSISECFGPFANHQAGYLIRKFQKKPVSKAILIGNISNYFLDQLIYSPKGLFEDFISEIFALDPLGIALLSDQEVREMMVLLENHFNHIKDVVINGLDQIHIKPKDCQVEPAFYSSKYGVQGRLDLFAINEQGASIVELKSGSAFRPNSYGLSNNHYHQTLLYDMLIESVFGSKLKRNNFILYSKESSNQLRFAPALKSEQREAIKERNLLYIHDRSLLRHDDFMSYYQAYASKHANNIKGFLRTDLNAFFKAFKTLDKTECVYANLFLKFTLRELFINKLGNEGSERSNGLAALWLQDLETKKEQFNIINHLEIEENSCAAPDPFIRLKLSEHSAVLSNFRVGDLGVLYPHQDVKGAILKQQVFKATILSMDEQSVVVRLRSRQENTIVFDQYKYWHVEHDTLENGYYEMTRSLYEFARAKKDYRDLMLCRRSPESYEVAPVSCGHNLTEEQRQIFSEIITSKDYYLLWGPPGTGKTSVMLREIAHHFIQHENDRVLFLAYTNRAVDEICEALYTLDPIPSFIRIGSRYSTGEKFVPHLLENQIKDITNRKELRDKLSKEQVYVGTVASVVGKVSLFELITFDIAIVDEASQILEPSLVGLLSRVGKFVLIGDHLQLPAVVQQDDSFTKVEEECLSDIGFKSLSSSLFERMYTTALNNDWDHAIGQLTHQGRMHIDIMSYVNDHFYNQQLKPIEGIDRLVARSFYKIKEDKLNRIVYVPSDVDLESESIKVNEYEAQQVYKICKSILDKCKRDAIGITKSTIGVITPYRAQIAAIRQKLRKELGAIVDMITIDTVERYQGGARDFIVMSCCMNYSFQMKALVSLSEEGVDRKLNVAITRSREQFVLIGNRAILEQNQLYKELIGRATLLES